MANRLGQKVKKYVRLGLKAGVVAGALGSAALGVKSTKDEYGKLRENERKQAISDIGTLAGEAGLKKMGGGGLPTASGGVAVGGNVIGADSSGNIMFGAGVQAGQGVVSNPNLRRGAQGQLPVGRLTEQQLSPFRQVGREAVRGAAGVVGGRIGTGEAVRDVAGAVFDSTRGRNDPTPVEKFRREREATATGTLVAGATGEERFTARESAAILGRRVKRAIPNPLKFVR